MTDNVKKIVPATLKPVPEVVDLMERMLAMAKSGEVRSVVLAATLTENRYHTAIETDDLISSMGLLYSCLHACASHGRENSKDFEP